MASIVHRDFTVSNDSAFHWWSALSTSLGGAWTLVVNNANTSAQNVDVRLPAGNLSASGAYRTSATENLTPIGMPAVSGGTASLSLPARSITTYTFGSDGTTPPICQCRVVRLRFLA